MVLEGPENVKNLCVRLCELVKAKHPITPETHKLPQMAVVVNENNKKIFITAQNLPQIMEKERGTVVARTLHQKTWKASNRSYYAGCVELDKVEPHPTIAEWDEIILKMEDLGYNVSGTGVFARDKKSIPKHKNQIPGEKSEKSMELKESISKEQLIEASKSEKHSLVLPSELKQSEDDFSSKDISLAKSSITSLSEIEANFEAEISASKSMTPEARLIRLAKARKIPETTSITTIVFKRNPDVVADVLCRAKGICEKCKNKAPFIRASDDSPYLEVHHIHTLADGGEDTVKNAIALCPNCHRQQHFGKK